MDLRSHYPYSLLRKGIIRSYPSLDKDIRADIAVVGAGITGALVAHHLCHAGLNVILLDRRHVGMGSTAASTGLLQYEIDLPLRILIKKIGEKKAIDSYKLCRKAIYDLKEICELLDGDTGFRLSPSFQFASIEKDLEGLKEEFRLRKNAGFSIEFLERNDIMSLYGFEKPGGLLSKDGGIVDAYALTHSLLAQRQLSLQVFDHTEIVKFNNGKHGVELTTDAGRKVIAKKLVIACGYESQRYLPFKVEKFQTTYSIVSERTSVHEPWYRNSLIWETSMPYLYLKTNEENRIFIGGKDDSFSDPKKRQAALNRKAKQLELEFRKLFPDVLFKTDFKWAGVFASTKDGLPFIGKIRQKPNLYFALGYGGNGITFSLLAAQLIRDDILGKKNSDAKLFEFGR